MRTLVVISLIWLRYGSFACQGDPTDTKGQVNEETRYSQPITTGEGDMDFQGNSQPMIKIIRFSPGTSPQVYDYNGRGGDWRSSILRSPSGFGQSGMDSEYTSRYSPFYPSNRIQRLPFGGGLYNAGPDPTLRRQNSRGYSSYSDGSELSGLLKQLELQTELLTEGLRRLQASRSSVPGRFDQSSRMDTRVSAPRDPYENEIEPDGKGYDFTQRASPTAGGYGSTRWPASQPPPRTQSITNQGGVQADQNRGDWEAVDSYTRDGRVNNGETRPTENMDYPRGRETGTQDSYVQGTEKPSSGGWPPRQIQSNMRPTFDGGMRTASFDDSRSPPYASRGYGSSYGGGGTVTNPSVAPSATQTRPAAGLDNIQQDNRFGNRGGGNIVARDPAPVPPPARVPPRAPSPTPIADQKDVTSASAVTSPTPQGELPTSIVLPMIHDKGNSLVEFTVGIAKPGFPDQKLKVNIDTGSSNLWLLTTESCARQLCYPNAVTYDKRKSDSYKPDGRYAEDHYGSGFVKGILGKETITIGDVTNKFSVGEVRIGEAQAWHVALKDFDVLCGMNIDMAEGSLLSQMVKQYGRALPFGIYFNKYYPERSKMIFGEGYQQFIAWDQLNSHTVHPTTKFNPTPTIEGWTVQVTGLGIEVPNQQPLLIDTRILAQLDTGAGALYGPPHIINKINIELFKYFPGQYTSDYAFPCQGNWQQIYLSMPNALIYIDGKKYEFLPYEYLGSHGGRCMSYFIPRNDVTTMMLGRAFMTRYFAMFDPTQKLVQLALAKQEAHQQATMIGQMEAYRWQQRH